MRTGRYLARRAFALSLAALFVAAAATPAAGLPPKGGAKAPAAGTKAKAPAARTKAKAPAAGTKAKGPAKVSQLVRAQNVAPRGASASERQLQDELDGILADKTFAGTRSGVYVVDLRTGQVLYSYGADDQLNPASNVKLVSTAAALDALGPDFAYRTRLLGAAPDAQGVVHGDVWLVGMSDPTLRPKDLANLAAELARRGVSRITGNLVISNDPNRDVLGLPNVEIAVEAGPKTGELVNVRVSPESAYFVVENSATVSPTAKITRNCRRVRVGKGKSAKRKKVCGGPVAAQLTLNLRPSSERDDGPTATIEVTGKLRPGMRYVVRRKAPSPTVFTAHTVRAHLKQAGITVMGGVREDDADSLDLVLAGAPGAELAELSEHRSVPLGTLVAMVNKPSNNWLADRVAELVGGEIFGEPTVDAGVRAMAGYLERIGIAPGTYLLENGSGLSYENHLSARQINEVLQAGYRNSRSGDTFFASMSVAGKDGTLRGRFRAHASKGFVFGKTGTLTGVAALSGFVRLGPDSKDVICFAIVTNGYRNARKPAIRAGQARLVDAMYRHLRRLEAGEKAAPPPEEPPPPDETTIEEEDVPTETPGEGSSENGELESDGTAEPSEGVPEITP